MVNQIKNGSTSLGNMDENRDPTYSSNLYDSWMECCGAILMCHGDIEDETTQCDNQEEYCIEEEDEMIPVIDLLHSSDCIENESSHNVFGEPNASKIKQSFTTDRWTENALLILASIEEMREYLKRESYAYVGSLVVPCLAHSSHTSSWKNLAMTEADQSIFESTVTSFTVGTANQIEKLRQTAAADADSKSNKDLMNHREGIIAILLSHLQNNVMSIMSDLHKVRMRRAMKDVLKEPLGCCKGFLTIPIELKMQEMNEKGLEGDLVPKHMIQQKDTSFFQQDAWDSNGERQDMNATSFLKYYEIQNEETQTQAFLSSKKGSKPFTIYSPNIMRKKSKTSNDDDEMSIPAAPPPLKPPIEEKNTNILKNRFSSTGNKQQTNAPYDINNEYKTEDEIEFEYMQNLQRENSLLTSQIQQSTQSLNEIHQIEQSMMQITTLLNQFTNLISEQQEDVMFIHETAVDSKNMMEKGTDKILNATERAKKGGHYMAKAIYGMAFILLFMNWAM